VHWRSTARYSQPVVREFERESAETLWLALELRTHENETAEELIETAASLAARAVARGERVGLATNDVIIDPGAGGAQLDRILDALARARIRSDAPLMKIPVAHEQCVHLAVRPAPGDWADVFMPGGMV